MFDINSTSLEKIKNFYDQNGFVIVTNAFSEKECDDIKLKADSYAEKPSYSVVLNLHRKSDFFLSVISNEKVVKIAKYIHQNDVDAVADQYLYKKPSSTYGKQAWTFHQDNSYPRAPSGNYFIVHLAVDKSEKENGGLIFLPGSHKEDILDFENNISWREKLDKDGIAKPGQTIKDKSVLEKYNHKNMTFPKGSVCFMHGNLIHASYPNSSSDRDRNQYSMCYMVRGIENYNKGKNSPKIRTQLY